jgi:hypothetical protein
MSNTQLRLRRGNTAEHANFTGAQGELTVDTDKNALVLHDGATLGGIQVARDAITATGSTTARSLEDRFGDVVNVLDYGVKNDGTEPTSGNSNVVRIQSLIDGNVGALYFPAGTYVVSDTINLGTRYRSLIGENPNKEDGGGNSFTKILYTGTTSSTKAVIKLGNNDVGVIPAPSTDSSGIVLQNLIIDADEKAGFGVYGTYLTNESLVDNITIKNSTEYNAYFAKAWYATFTNIVSENCKGKGLAFGMPLVLQDGTSYITSSSDLQINQCQIDNVRSTRSGRYYSIDNPNTYDPTNTTHRMQGYGIGAGIGNGFTLTNFLSELSGGTNLYVYSDAQPRKTIQYGYLEGGCLNSGLNPASTLPAIILENTGDPNGIEVRDIYTKYSDGGILHTGTLSGTTWLKNIHQPRFLLSLDGVSTLELWSYILKENVYFGCGLYNTKESLMGTSGYGQVNTRYSFTVDVQPGGGRKAIYVKLSSGTEYYGNYYINYEDGTSQTSATFPTLTGDWQLDVVANPKAVSLTKSGGTGSLDNTVDFKILSTPETFE